MWPTEEFSTYYSLYTYSSELEIQHSIIFQISFPFPHAINKTKKKKINKKGVVGDRLRSLS